MMKKRNKRLLSKSARREERQFWLFILPWIVGFCLFTLVPILCSIVFSLFRFSKLDLAMGNQLEFVGTDNFEKIFREIVYYEEGSWHIGHFGEAIGNTFFYAIVRVFVGLAVSFLFAALLNRNLKFKKLFRVLIYIPAIIPIVGSAIVWKGLFDERFSFFNYLLNYLGIGPINWLGTNAMGSVLLMSVWCGIGPTMIIILAALQSVPNELLEAAKVDGANVFHRYVHIVLPMISPTILYILITGFISCLQAYAEFDLVTGGGPGYSTTTMSMLVIRAMDGEGLGYACAMAWVICLIVMVFTLLFFRFTQKRVYYAEGDDK